MLVFGAMSIDIGVPAVTSKNADALRNAKLSISNTSSK